MTTIRELQTKVGEINAANGWRTGADLRDHLRHIQGHREPTHPERREVEQRVVDHQIAVLALITTEVAEAIEEIRKGHSADETYYPSAPTAYSIVPDAVYKPEGVPSELADVVIRALDFAETWGIDLEQIITEKLAYNATRGHRHGGKTL